jgi:hypothetical protein
MCETGNAPLGNVTTLQINDGRGFLAVLKGNGIRSVAFSKAGFIQ